MVGHLDRRADARVNRRLVSQLARRVNNSAVEALFLDDWMTLTSLTPPSVSTV